MSSEIKRDQIVQAVGDGNIFDNIGRVIYVEYVSFKGKSRLMSLIIADINGVPHELVNGAFVRPCSDIISNLEPAIILAYEGAEVALHELRKAISLGYLGRQHNDH